MVSFEYLRTLSAVSRMGSFTAAARYLGISQPTVIAQMHALEKSLGYRLFEHDGHAAALTARGRILAERIGGPVEALEDVAAPITEPAMGGGTRVIHIAGPREYLSARAIPLLSGLSHSHPSSGKALPWTNHHG